MGEKHRDEAEPLLHVVVMGVSGSGKSAVARPLADRLGFDFAEGDEFHPKANVEKMSAGKALTDEDRWPWLRLLAEWIREHDRAGRSTVITCSALRRSYRDVLRSGGPGICFVHLTGDKGLILERMGSREHFMPSTLLESQLDTLQDLDADENGFEVDIVDSVATIVDTVVARLRGR